MPDPSFVKTGLVLRKGVAGDSRVRDLQQALRDLGYITQGIDGDFGSRTENGLMALQYDLLRNDGTGADGNAAVKLTAYNKGRIAAVTGVMDQNTARCLSDMLSDAAIIRLPRVSKPAEANRAVIAAITATRLQRAPMRFLAAMMKQESDLRHYNEVDGIITVGLDRNDSARKYRITSRGYGAGQFTIFHHPPRPAEVNDFMLDPLRNLSKAVEELREKFDRFVNGPADAADDRRAEIGSEPLRVCKYDAVDARYLSDCRNCATAAGSRDIIQGQTRLHPGTDKVFEPTQYYKIPKYSNIPRREAIGCDWPYAARRYNGGGVNSYHYQARILRNVRDLVL